MPALVYLPAAQANAAIVAIFPVPGTDYLGLNTGSPALTGANETSGGAGPYVRQSCTFGAASLGVELSANAQNFLGMPSATIGYFSLWTALTAGTYEGGGALTSSLTVPAGATVAFAIGALSVSVTG